MQWSEKNDVFFLRLQLEPRYNEPLHKDVVGITKIFLTQ